MTLTRTASILAILALASGCGKPGPVAEEAEDTVILNAAEAGRAPPDAAPAAINEAEDWGSENGPPSPVSSITFPDQYRGRWALAPADCEPGRSNSKGLMTIGEQSIYFYESVGKLKQHIPAVATSFSGLFAFTGEGQSWEKVISFSRVGDTLIRHEKDGRFTYKRCS